MSIPAKTSIQIFLLFVSGALAIWITQDTIKKIASEREEPLQNLETTLLLSSGKNGKGKVNTLGQKRNLEVIRKETGQEPHEIKFVANNNQINPPATWEDTPFPPLLIVKTNQSQGSLELQGNLITEKTKISLKGNELEVKIHPKYNWDLFQNGQREEILNLTYQNTSGKTLQQEILIEWSEEDEIFLADNCLPHLAALTDTKSNPIIRSDIKTMNPTQEDIIQWIKETANSLKPYNIEYEELPEENIHGLGWQKIRTPENILKERKGNCLDLSIFWAGMMLNQNLQTWIIIVPEHAFVAVGPKGSGTNTAITLETTMLTGINLQEKTVEKAIEAGHKRIREELSKSQDSVTVIDINYWKNFFKE